MLRATPTRERPWSPQSYRSGTSALGDSGVTDFNPYAAFGLDARDAYTPLSFSPLPTQSVKFIPRRFPDIASRSNSRPQSPADSRAYSTSSGSESRPFSPGHYGRRQRVQSPKVRPMVAGTPESTLRTTIGAGHLGMHLRRAVPVRIDRRGSHVFPEPGDEERGFVLHPDVWLTKVAGNMPATMIPVGQTEFKRVTEAVRQEKLKQQVAIKETKSTSWNGQGSLLAHPVLPADSHPLGHTQPSYDAVYDGPYSFEASRRRPLFGSPNMQVTNFGLAPLNSLTGWNAQY